MLVTRIGVYSGGLGVQCTVQSVQCTDSLESEEQGMERDGPTLLSPPRHAGNSRASHQCHDTSDDDDSDNDSDDMPVIIHCK